MAMRADLKSVPTNACIIPPHRRHGLNAIAAILLRHPPLLSDESILRAVASSPEIPRPEIVPSCADAAPELQCIPPHGRDAASTPECDRPNRSLHRDHA